MRIAALAASAFLGACAGDAAKKSDLTILENQLKARAAQDQNTVRAELSKMREDLVRYETLAKRIELQAEEVDRVLKAFQKDSGAVLAKVDVANTNVFKSLEIQEQYLKQLLESIRALIEDLKKK